MIYRRTLKLKTLAKKRVKSKVFVLYCRAVAGITYSSPHVCWSCLLLDDGVVLKKPLARVVVWEFLTSYLCTTDFYYFVSTSFICDGSCLYWYTLRWFSNSSKYVEVMIKMMRSTEKKGRSSSVPISTKIKSVPYPRPKVSGIHKKCPVSFSTQTPVGNLQAIIVIRLSDR